MLLSPRRRRAAGALPVLALVGVVLSTAGAGAGTAAAASPLESPAQAAATWTASRLTDGSHVGQDHGLTADVVLGLAATRTGGTVAGAATDWLAANADAYISHGVSGNVNAGAAAKLALVAAVEHRDATDFGGVDLVATLLGRMRADGRFTDAAATDLSNQFTQSFAVLALDRAKALPDTAADFLADSRCADGGYPLAFRSDPTKCAGDVDATGLAVQALLAVGRTEDAAPALAWLAGRQNTDGGFAYAPGGHANSNTTALATQALAGGGRDEAAARGAAWLTSRQLGCAAPTADRGAVGYLEPVVDGSALRATAQALPALAGKELGEIDGAGSAPGLTEISCGPGDGTSGGTGGDDGGTDSGGADGGTDGGTQGGDSSGGTDPTASPSPSTSAGASGGTTSGTSSGSTGGGAVGGGSVGGTPGGGLASTGAPALPLAGAAAILLALGTSALLLVRSRRPRH